MLKYPYGKQRIIDSLNYDLDEIEKHWPMTGSYERVDPYIIPFIRGREYFEFMVYHIESKLWFDNFQHDYIMDSMADKKLIVPGDVVFDLGSNSGAVSLIMAKLCGDEGSLHAFDPYPWNASATRHNARLNYLSNVTAHAVGVSNRSYQISVSPNDSRIYESSPETNAQVLEIEAINKFMHLRPTFLKIDIEGAEHDVFEGQTPDVFASVRSFVLEFHPFWIRPRGIDPKEFCCAASRIADLPCITTTSSIPPMSSTILTTTITSSGASEPKRRQRRRRPKTFSPLPARDAVR